MVTNDHRLFISAQTDWMFSDPDTGTMIATRILVERPREPLVVIMPGRAPDGPTQWELKTPSFPFENNKKIVFCIWKFRECIGSSQVWNQRNSSGCYPGDAQHGQQLYSMSEVYQSPTPSILFRLWVLYICKSATAIWYYTTMPWARVCAMEKAGRAGCFTVV